MLNELQELGEVEVLPLRLITRIGASTSLNGLSFRHATSSNFEKAASSALRPWCLCLQGFWAALVELAQSRHLGRSRAMWAWLRDIPGFELKAKESVTSSLHSLQLQYCGYRSAL